MTTTDEKRPYDSNLTKLVEDYYTHYYRDLLGLKDWIARVDARLVEEDRESRVIDNIENLINYSFKGKRVLVMGAGTGGELFALRDRGAEVIGIEPDRKATDIIAAKAKSRGMGNPSLQAVGEALPLASEQFDFTYCYTVLEHTTDPLLCIDEMLRVTKKGGWLFIMTPDYRFPYEGHYKIHWPPFVPRFVSCIYLKLKNRPTEFLWTLNFVNAKQLQSHLQNRNTLTMQIFWPIPPEWRESPSLSGRLRLFFLDKLGIQRDAWLLAKVL
jgi:SAM-dependent methyltransferase